MLPNQPSRTALATGYLRAAHQLLDPPPRLLEDPLAVAVLGEGAADRIQSEVARYNSMEARSLRSHVVLRSRFTEDRLAEAVTRGVSQYVVLGAGLDTFAFRQPAWVTNLSIIEIDHPNTQRFKRTSLEKAGIPTPPNVTFVESDFNRDSLLDDLTREGVSSSRPTFFSWLGVSMYVTGEVIDRTLKALGIFARGSEVVLTFMPPPPKEVNPSSEAVAKLASLAQASGEPFISFLHSAEIDDKLRRAGFSTVYILTPEEARARYYSAPTSYLPPPRAATIASGIR